MEPFFYDAFVIRDSRTDRYFGGGVATELFSCWVSEWHNAKLYTSIDQIRPVIEQMIVRKKKYDKSRNSKSEILKETPLYESGALMIHKVTVTKIIEENGMIVQ